MTSVDVDLTCRGAVEEAIQNGMKADNVQWVCHECGTPATARRDVEEL